MLQQTTVAAVIPYFGHWMKRFPDVQVLAGADEQDVMALWQGLGYYSRARNLLRAAREVTVQYGGTFPRDPGLLRALPGFGEYTAAAVAAFAFDHPSVVLDANIIRVLARLGDLGEPVDTAAGRAGIEELARALWPVRRGGRAFTGALMELGALICRPRNPLCHQCPVRTFCRTPHPEALPVKKSRPRIESLRDCRSVILHGRTVALSPSSGPRWRGLWLLPETERPPTARAAFTEKFSVTRFRVSMEIFPGLHPPPAARFFPLDSLPPMPSPHSRALKRWMKVHAPPSLLRDRRRKK